jgi:hypothetical protein
VHGDLTAWNVMLCTSQGGQQDRSGRNFVAKVRVLGRAGHGGAERLLKTAGASGAGRGGAGRGRGLGPPLMYATLSLPPHALQVADFGLSRTLDVKSKIKTRTYGTVRHASFPVSPRSTLFGWSVPSRVLAP